MNPDNGSLHGMPAADVSTYLIKRHLCGFDFFDPILQIKPFPIWQSLAFDLLLANGDKQFWGWQDAQAIRMLDYWIEVDADFCFVMVYDSPENVLARKFHNKFINEEELKIFIDEWRNYNSALLNFFSRHPDRCMLLHSSTMVAHVENFVDLFNSRFNYSLEISHQYHADEENNIPHSTGIAENILHDSELDKLYNDLQSSADLPKIERKNLAPIADWNMHVELFLKSEKSVEIICGLQAKLAHHESVIESYIEEKNATLRKFTEQKEENNLLLVSLNRMQEELLKKHSGLSQSNKKNQALENKVKDHENDAKELKVKIEYFERELHLVGRYKSIDEVNKFLLLNLHQLQVEFQSIHSKYKILKMEVDSRKLAEAARAAQMVLKEENSSKKYGAADRVKKQLSYRIGNVLVENCTSLSGVIRLPNAMLKQIKEFKADKKAQVGIKLLPIDRYADAHEAVKIQQHLSYRLGKVLLENYKTPLGWVKIPLIFNREVKNFRSNRHAQKK